MPDYLYSSSLEDKLNSYMDGVRQTEFNEKYQLLQNEIIFDAQRLNLTTIEILNKLNEMESELKKSIQPSLIPFSKTDVENKKKSRKRIMKEKVEGEIKVLMEGLSKKYLTKK